MLGSLYYLPRFKTLLRSINRLDEGVFRAFLGEGDVGNLHTYYDYIIFVMMISKAKLKMIEIDYSRVTTIFALHSLKLLHQHFRRKYTWNKTNLLPERKKILDPLQSESFCVALHLSGL